MGTKSGTTAGTTAGTAAEEQNANPATDPTPDNGTDQDQDAIQKAVHKAVQGADQGAPGVETAPKAGARRFQTTVMLLLLMLPVAGMVLVYRNPMSSLMFWAGIALISALGLAVFYARHARRMAFFEEFLLGEVFVMSLIGIGLTNVAPQSGLRFWLAMSVLLTMSALVMGAMRMVDRKAGSAAFMLTQAVHWGATLLAVGAIYELFRAGRLNHDNTALMVLLVLGLSTFLDGYRVSWRFALIGVLMGATALMAAYVEQFTWPMVVVAAALLAAVVLWQWRRHRRSR